MNKDIIICFRTDKEIRKSLDKIAKEERQTLSAIIETAIYNHLKEKKALQGLESEKRQYARKQVSLPAFIMDKGAETREIKTGKVLDISLGGMRLSVPRGVKLEVSTDRDDDTFHVIFTLPEATQPLNMECKSQRMFEGDEDVQIGAAFINGDFQSFQALQNYLI